MARQFDFVAEFATEIHNQVSPTSVSEFLKFDTFFSKEDEGALYLDRQDAEKYREVVGKLWEICGGPDEISKRTVETYVQEVLFCALDILSKRQAQTFEDRLQDGLRTLREKVSLPRQAYTCYIQVSGVSNEGLPFELGKIRFMVMTSEDAERVFLDQDKRLLGGTRSLIGKTCALVKVAAKDTTTAQLLAERECSRASDVLNFFSDLIRYNNGWAYLPGEAESTLAESWIVGANTSVVVSVSRKGPLAPFVIANLGSNKSLKAPFSRVQDLYRSGNGLAETILTALQWAGRATVDVKREQSFLLFAIALETLILPIQDQELGYRLGQRLGRLLSNDPNERIRIQKDIKQLYRVRSKIVHSGSYEVRDEDLGHLHVLVKKAFLQILHSEQIRELKNSEQLEEWFEQCCAT